MSNASFLEERKKEKGREVVKEREWKGVEKGDDGREARPAENH